MRINARQAQAKILGYLQSVENLVSVVAAGRRKGLPAPPCQRVDMRPVELKGELMVQVVQTGDAGPRTTNVEASAQGLSQWIELPFGNWHIETVTESVQIRFTKKGDAFVATTPTSKRAINKRTLSHDRPKERLIAPDDPLFDVLGAGADKRRQVDAFLRISKPTIDAAFDVVQPLRVVDLGCGNAYLTFAMHRYLADQRPGTTTLGIEQRPELVDAATARAQQAGLTGLEFTASAIDQSAATDVDVALALHACDTATDDALAWAVQSGAPVILAAPCCHHDINAQLGQRAANTPDPLLEHNILRERFADVLTDSLRAQLLEMAGYDVDVVEFVDSRHTPRNALIRAKLRPDAGGAAAAHRTSYEALVQQWGVRPRLAGLLGTG